MVEKLIWETSDKAHVSHSFLMLRLILDYTLTIYVGLFETLCANPSVTCVNTRYFELIHNAILVP